MKNAVIIVAGGAGIRMQSTVPKQFIVINGFPILIHTIKTFFDFDNSIKIVLVLPKNHFNYWKDLCTNFNFNITHNIVIGGEERFFSVKNGLESLNNIDFVAIHDGVRPLVDKEVIKSGFELVKNKNAVIPVVPISSSVRIINNDESRIIDRTKLRIVQTPQIFNFDILKKAYNVDYNTFFTDDASVFENYGQKVFLFDGNTENIKITTKSDLIYAEAVLKNQNNI